MYNIISISLGEIVLKGKNRGYFERKLSDKIKYSLKEFKGLKIYKDSGKTFIETTSIEDIPEIQNRVKKIFGIVQISRCVKVDKDLEIIKEKTKEIFSYYISKKKVNTFKIVAKRTDKKFPIKSMELNNILGAEILKNFDNIKVDVHNPDLLIYVDIRKNCYLYTEKIKTSGGLPIGTNGKGLLLLSGGIDSPVAGYLMAKRGVEVDAIYFHTYPFSSERANEKVKKLAQKLTDFCGKIKIYSINILEIHKAIKNQCPEKETTILARRFMIRIAEKIALENEIDVLITGESLGQVASQTIKSLGVINDVANIPILRPLIGMDKTEIIEISKEIDTYETSILPYEDCCSIFAPKHPVTKPKLKGILLSEENLEIENLINIAYNTIEIDILR